MGLKIFKTKRTANGQEQMHDVTDVVCDAVTDAALEFQIRELSFWTCVNFVANAIGRCEVKTYVERAETRGREYYMWNVEPNTNQSSSAFWHKAIAKLFEENEALIIPTRKRDGFDAVVVADDWIDGEEFPSRQNEYSGVVVGDMEYAKTFYERDVIHLKLHHTDLKPVISGITASYMKLVQTAMSAYSWDNGQHWKVHVNQMTSGKDGWLDTFQQMLEKQIKPFMASGSAILPEFDGYDFTNLGGKNATAKNDTRDIKAMIEDIFSFTCRGFGIPDVLIKGEVENTGNATRRALTTAIDPICDQIGEEITRKRYGFELWSQGSYARMDSSAIEHFDLFGSAANIEKLVGSGWSVNDIRRAAGEETINESWADEHFITKNFELASALIAAQEGGNANE
jgi:HK97 family phage portal protein